jgi:hypothetical protein
MRNDGEEIERLLQDAYEIACRLKKALEKVQGEGKENKPQKKGLKPNNEKEESK